ncbi:MAG: hypothetical protein ACRD0C_22100 [Acidimicrobiia bacterium]
MISQAAFDSLRMAATLALAVPSLALRISSPMRSTGLPGRPLVEVSWVPRRTPAGVQHLPPCMFRRCMGCAHHRRLAGEPVTLLGLPDGVDPAVEVLVSPGDRRLPSGIYQVQVEGAWRVVLPTLVPPARCTELLTPEWSDLGFHGDPLLGVTLVTLHRPAAQGPVVGEAAERMVEAQSRLLVDELIGSLEPAPRS